MPGAMIFFRNYFAGPLVFCDDTSSPASYWRSYVVLPDYRRRSLDEAAALARKNYGERVARQWLRDFRRWRRPFFGASIQKASQETLNQVIA